VRTYDGDVRLMQAATEAVKDLTFAQKVLSQLKENRVEAMIVTILLYSTGLLEKVYVAGVGVC
jgi:hypothetical protein